MEDTWRIDIMDQEWLRQTVRAQSLFVCIHHVHVGRLSHISLLSPSSCLFPFPLSSASRAGNLPPSYLPCLNSRPLYSRAHIALPNQDSSGDSPRHALLPGTASFSMHILKSQEPECSIFLKRTLCSCWQQLVSRNTSSDLL
jgi:hypothetical protein